MGNVTDHLANERTYLAWLRTSSSLLGLGFATNKFAQFLAELHAKSGEAPPKRFLLGSEHFGIGMVIVATILIAISSWHYQRTRREIETDSFRPHSGLIRAISVVAFGLGLAVIWLVFQN